MGYVLRAGCSCGQEDFQHVEVFESELGNDGVWRIDFGCGESSAEECANCSGHYGRHGKGVCLWTVRSISMLKTGQSEEGIATILVLTSLSIVLVLSSLFCPFNTAHSGGGCRHVIHYCTHSVTKHCGE
jgi:hypothetical protein